MPDQLVKIGNELNKVKKKKEKNNRGSGDSHMTITIITLMCHIPIANQLNTVQ